MKYDWVENLLAELAARWREWKNSLGNLRNDSIPRCFIPCDFGEVERVDLHHSAEASEGQGYGTVSYLNLSTRKDGSTSVLIWRNRE